MTAILKRTEVLNNKHNSPTAAMVGLYLLVADGELGNKVYSAAKEGKQAWVVQDHAIKMTGEKDSTTDS